MKRLVVGGLHGREGKIVGPKLERFALDGRPRSGVLIVVPSLCRKSKYVSTLSERYFETEEGQRLLNLLERCKPDVYVEVHCYAKKAYKALTSPNRMIKRRVPELVELENGLLVGPPTPHLLIKNFFRLGMIVEIPCSEHSHHDALLTLLRAVRDQETIEKLLDKLATLYSGHFHRAIELYESYKKEVFENRGLKEL